MPLKCCQIINIIFTGRELKKCKVCKREVLVGSHWTDPRIINKIWTSNLWVSRLTKRFHAGRNEKSQAVLRKTRLSDSEIFLYMLCPPQRASKEWDAAVSPVEEPDTPVTNSGIWSLGLHWCGRRAVTAESQTGSMPVGIGLVGANETRLIR